MIYNQEAFDIRMDWGYGGVRELASISDVIIIVDVLSFFTCVDIATARGALIYPYRWKDESAISYAQEMEAELADFKRKFTAGFSLSPTSLTAIEAQTKLVLPSPNGATLSLATGSTPTLCGSLRNAAAVAAQASEYGNRIGIIAAGEQWPDQSLRVAFEDAVGAGAIISYLTGTLSPESKASLAIFESAKSSLLADIKNCSSGKELIERGFEQDIDLACDFNVSPHVPLFKEGRFYVGTHSY